MVELNSFKLFDAHFHIIDSRFPLIPNDGYLPGAFTVDDYRQRLKDYDLCGGAVVSGSFQDYDQSYLIDALEKLGAGFVGVTQLPATITDQEIIKLNEKNIRAIRFNLKRGGSEGIEQLEAMGRHVFDLVGWHTELYVDSTQLDSLFDTLIKLPKVSIDHLGLSRTGFNTLLKLAENDIKIKASGFSRVDFDIAKALKDLYSVNPACLMFGTDLPSTRAPMPYQDKDYQLLIDTLGEEATHKVLMGNAQAFYKASL